MAGAVVLADALADRAGGIEGAFAAYEARLRPWMEAARGMVRRNVRLFTPANRFPMLARDRASFLLGRGTRPEPEAVE